MRRSFLAVLSIGFLACSSSDGGSSTTDGTKAPAGCTEGAPGCFGWVTCPPEMSADPDLGGCREIVPASACAAGTMALLGAADCQPVGTTSCAAGFKAGKSGWGCDADLPAKACTGATRDAIGNASCVPVGDCNAAFPPANATLFVSPTAVEDATHFKTIAGAIAAASANAVIAIDSGTYSEGMQPKSNGLTIVGRCAEKVRLVGTGQDVWGLLANGVKGISVSGVTLVDHYEGIRAQSGSVTITDSVIEAPRGSGMIAWPSGSLIHAERVVVRGVKPQPSKPNAPTLGVNADGGGTVEMVDSAVTGSWGPAILASNYNDPKHTSTIKLDGVVVRDTNLAGNEADGAGVVVTDYAKGEITRSVVTDVKRFGVLAVGKPSTVTVTSSLLRKATMVTADSSPAGAAAFEGGHVELVETTLRDNQLAGVYALADGSLVRAKNSVIETSKPDPTSGDFGIGAWAMTKGALALESTALIRNSYYGIGAWEAGTKVDLKNVLVSGVGTDRNDQFGRGLDVETGAAVTADGLTLEGTGDGAIFLHGETKTGARTSLDAKRLYVHAMTGGGDRTAGMGIEVRTGAVLTLDTAAFVAPVTGGILLNEVLGEAGSSAEATITNTVVRDPVGGRDIPTDSGDFGLSGFGIASSGKLTVTKTAVINAFQFGFAVSKVSGDVANVLVHGTRPGKASASYGYGIAILSAPLILRDSVIRQNQGGIIFDNGSGAIGGTLVQKNAIGINVQGDGMSLVTAPKAPDAPPEKTVVVGDDSTFLDNETRVGSGAMPVPTVLGPAETNGGAPKR